MDGLKTLLRQTHLETKLFYREKQELFWTIAFPVFFVVLYGFIYGDTVWEDQDMRAMDYVAPGLVVMALMINGLMSTATGFVEDREKGIYRRISLTPLKRRYLIGGRVLNRYLVLLVQTALLIAIAVLAFDVSYTGSPALLWLVITVGGLAFIAIGFLTTSLVSNARSVSLVTLVVFFLFTFLGGVFYPIELMPGFVQGFAQVLPSTHVNDALRGVMIEDAGLATIWQDLLVAIGWFVGALLLTARFLKWE